MEKGTLCRIIKEAINIGTSKRREDKIFAYAYLIEIGKIGERVYNLSEYDNLINIILKIYEQAENIKKSL